MSETPIKLQPAQTAVPDESWTTEWHADFDKKHDRDKAFAAARRAHAAKTADEQSARAGADQWITQHRAAMKDIAKFLPAGKASVLTEPQRLIVMGVMQAARAVRVPHAGFADALELQPSYAQVEDQAGVLVAELDHADRARTTLVYDHDLSILQGGAALTDGRVRSWIEGIADDFEVVLITPRVVEMSAWYREAPHSPATVEDFARRYERVAKVTGAAIGFTIPERFR